MQNMLFVVLQQYVINSILANMRPSTGTTPSHFAPLVTIIHCHNGAAPLDLRVADYRVEIMSGLAATPQPLIIVIVSRYVMLGKHSGCLAHVSKAWSGGLWRGRKIMSS
jgi:hypothetical protein